MTPLLTGYVRSLADQIQSLREANNTNDYDRLIEYARGLKGCGASYGFPDISTSATAALMALDSSTPDMDEIKRLVNALCQVLSRVKVRHAQSTQEPEENKAK